MLEIVYSLYKWFTKLKYAPHNLFFVISSHSACITSNKQSISLLDGLIPIGPFLDGNLICKHFDTLIKRPLSWLSSGWVLFQMIELPLLHLERCVYRWREWSAGVINYADVKHLHQWDSEWATVCKINSNALSTNIASSGIDPRARAHLSSCWKEMKV